MFRKGCCSQRPPTPSPDQSRYRPVVLGISRESAELLPSTRGLVVCAYFIQAVFSNLLHVADAKVFMTQLTQRVVPTQYGRLRGMVVTPPGGTLPQVEAFLGIEYASLLGGELRFMPPTSPLAKWEGVRNAIKFKPVCPQKLPDLEEVQRHSPTSVVDHFQRLIPFLERQQEDCLNLNVYVPLRGNPVSVLSAFSPLSLSLSVSLSVCLSLSPSVRIYLSIGHFLCLYVYFCLSVYFSVPLLLPILYAFVSSSAQYPFCRLRLVSFSLFLVGFQTQMNGFDRESLIR